MFRGLPKPRVFTRAGGGISSFPPSGFGEIHWACPGTAFAGKRLRSGPSRDLPTTAEWCSLIKVTGTPNSPRWYTIPVRAALVTFLGTLICFAVALLLGIMGTAVVSWFDHVHPDMRIAYRHVALPAAMVSGALLLALSLALEIRHYRQSKTLAAIARMSADRPLPTS